MSPILGVCATAFAQRSGPGAGVAGRAQAAGALAHRSQVSTLPPLDQPGRITGTIRLDGEDIPVDCYGMRDRSWGRWGGFGKKIIKHGGHQAGYCYATESPKNTTGPHRAGPGRCCAPGRGIRRDDPQVQRLWRELAAAEPPEREHIVLTAREQLPAGAAGEVSRDQPTSPDRGEPWPRSPVAKERSRSTAGPRTRRPPRHRRSVMARPSARTP